MCVQSFGGMTCRWAVRKVNGSAKVAVIIGSSYFFESVIMRVPASNKFHTSQYDFLKGLHFARGVSQPHVSN